MLIIVNLLRGLSLNDVPQIGSHGHKAAFQMMMSRGTEKKAPHFGVKKYHF